MWVPNITGGYVSGLFMEVFAHWGSLFESPWSNDYRRLGFVLRPRVHVNFHIAESTLRILGGPPT